MPEHKAEFLKATLNESLVLPLYFALFSLMTLGVGAGGALSAMYKGLFRVLNDRPGDHARARRFKEDLVSTMPQSLFALIVLFASGSAAYTVLTLANGGYTLILLGGLFAFETWLLAAYIFPAFAVFRFANTLHAFRTALLMGHFHALTTAKLIVAFAIAFIAPIAVTLYLLPLSIVLYVFLSARALHPTFMTYVNRIEASRKTEPSGDTPTDTPVDTRTGASDDP